MTRDPRSNRRVGSALRPVAALLALLVLCGLTAGLVMAGGTGGNPLDQSFGDGGVEVTSAEGIGRVGLISGLAQDSKGRVLATALGSGEDFVLLRYRADGSLDRSLKGNGGSAEREPGYRGGLVETSVPGVGGAHAVAVQADGRIVVLGSTYDGRGIFALIRYREDGTTDAGFGKGGSVLTPLGIGRGRALGLAIQTDGRILAGGGFKSEGEQRERKAVLVRYRPDGKLDPTFGRGGIVSIAGQGGALAQVSDLLVLPSGKILAVGGLDGRFLVARLMPNGRLDPSFGQDGLVLTDVDGESYCSSGRCAYATSVAISRGRIVVSGNAGTRRGFSVLARYRSDGRLDRSFGNAGFATAFRGYALRAEDMVAQPSGRIIIAGTYEGGKVGNAIEVLRYLPSGTLDPSFGRSGVFLPSLGVASGAFTALLERGGRVVVGGSVGFRKGPPTRPLLLRLR